MCSKIALMEKGGRLHCFGAIPGTIGVAYEIGIFYLIVLDSNNSKVLFKGSAVLKVNVDSATALTIFRF